MLCNLSRQVPPTELPQNIESPPFCPPTRFQKKNSCSKIHVRKFMSCSKSWFPTFTRGERGGEETMVINILVS